MARKTKKRKKHTRVVHQDWCREGILFRHEGEDFQHAWCMRCQGEKCPTCFPNAYAAKKRGYYPVPPLNIPATEADLRRLEGLEDFEDAT